MLATSQQFLGTGEVSTKASLNHPENGPIAICRNKACTDYFKFLCYPKVVSGSKNISSAGIEKIKAHKRKMSMARSSTRRSLVDEEQLKSLQSKFDSATDPDFADVSFVVNFILSYTFWSKDSQLMIICGKNTNSNKPFRKSTSTASNLKFCCRDSLSGFLK